MLTPDQIQAIAKQRGDTLVNPTPPDSLSAAQTLQNAWATPTNTVATSPSDQSQPGLLSKIFNFFNPTATQSVIPGLGFNPAAPGGIPGAGDIGIGALKSVGDTAVGTYQLGQKLGNKISGVAGLPQQQIIQSPDVLKTTSPEQQLGKTIGEVAQFFAPGSAEIKAGEGIDKLVDAAKFAERFGPEAGKALNGILKVIGHGLTMGASTAGITAAQTGGDVGKTETAGALGFGAGALGKTLELVSPGLNRAIARANLRLTDSQEAKLNTQAKAASSFIADNGLWGTPNMQFNKLQKINGSFEKVIQSTFKDGTAPKETLLKYLDEIPNDYKTDPAVYAKVKNDVESAKAVLNETQGDTIKLSDILEGKRSYGKAAFDKAGNQLLKESKFSIQDAYYKTLEDHMAVSAQSGEQNIQLPKDIQKYFGGKSEVSLRDFNKVYSQSVNAERFMNIAKNKSDVGFIGKVIGALAGAAGARSLGPLGEIGGSFLGAEAASKGGTLIRSGLGKIAAGGETTIPFATKVGLGLSATQGQQDQSQ